MSWNNMNFSTFDNNNDASNSRSSANCAGVFGGGNWWGNCGNNNINGKYGGNGDIGPEFMWWLDFDKNVYTSLKTMTLMFRQVD